jgi:hypothetical protein
MPRQREPSLAVSALREDLDLLGAVTAPGQDREPDDPARDEIRLVPRLPTFALLSDAPVEVR